MAGEDSGRPPPEAFVTVRDPKQARLLSDPKSYAFFRPFVACEKSVSEAAAEVGCAADTMLYRVKTFERVAPSRLPPEKTRGQTYQVLPLER
jgi:hypothetical protein